MRNLKKVLVLVLCFAMILGIMVVGAGAAFTDQDSIDALHQDAVDMCVALNIINGMPDGSFNPTGDVTREQMAKMICILDNGGKEPQGSTGTTFSDVAADRWSNKYIESCAARGVVAGIGGGKFDPEGNVTGSQAAKMLLVELGYDQDIAKYTGAGWDTNVNIDATKNGYYDDLEDIDVSAPLSREHAAQMIWNALQANEIAYSYTLVTNPDGSISSVVTASNKDQYGNDLATLLADKYGYDTNLALVTDVAYDEDDGTYTTSFMLLNDDYDPLFVEDHEGPVFDDFDGDKDYSDLFMMAVQVVYDDNGDPIAVARDNSAVLAEGIVNDIDDADDGDNKITIGDKEYKLDNDDDEMVFVGYLNAGDEVYFLAQEGENAGDDLEPIDGAATMNLYWNIALVDLDGNGKGDGFIVYPTYVGQVTFAGNNNISADTPYAGKQSFKFEDNDIYDGAEDDDYILITLGRNTVADTKDNKINEDATITKLDLTTATVSGIKDDSIQIDGTWSDLDLYNEVEFTSGDDFDIATVNGIVVAAEPNEDSSTDILFISAVAEKPDIMVGEDSGTIDAKAYFANGDKEGIITVKKIDGEKVKAGTTIKTGVMYTYTVADGEYTLKTVGKDDVKAGYDTFSKGEGYVKDDGTLGAVKIADDAVIFLAVCDGDKITSVDVVDGAKLKAVKTDQAGASDILANTTSGIDYAKVAAFRCTEDESPVASSDTMYAYVIDAPYTASEKNDKDETVNTIVIPVWDGEQATELVFNKDEGDSDSNMVKNLKAGTAFSYVIEDDKYADDIKPVEKMAAITGFEAADEGLVKYYEIDPDTKVVTATSSKNMDEDVVFIGFNSNDYDLCQSGIGMKDIKVVKADGNKINPNAWVVVENDKITAIFYDLTGNIYDKEGGDPIWATIPS